MRRVILESPFAGRNAWQRFRNRRYARACMRDALARGEAPLASHLLYTQMLNDNLPHERTLGIEAGLSWLHVAAASVVYIDRGISRGMLHGINAALSAGVVVEYRSLHGAIRVGDQPSSTDRDSGNSLDVAILLDAREGRAAGLMYRRITSDVLPPHHRHIDVGWVDFHSDTFPA
jgi:hypothetical protein